MSVANLESARDLAIAARRAGDYAGAIGYAMDAKMYLSTLPNVTRNSGGGSQSIAWNSGAIDSFIAECRQMETAAAVKSAGIRRSNVTYARVTE
jgi:hypothetical protein